MKLRENSGYVKNKYGQDPFGWVSGKDASPQAIYNKLWDMGYGGVGYKFAIIIDMSCDEYEEPEREQEIYYLDTILDEAIEYVGEWAVKKKLGVE
jgi:hypothetical protein